MGRSGAPFRRCVAGGGDVGPGLGVASWQAPSAPHDELSNVPEYQIRATTPLPGTGGVIVIYRVEGSTDIVDLWWVGRW